MKEREPGFILKIATVFVSSGEEGLDGKSMQLKRDFNSMYWPKWSMSEERSLSAEEPSA